MSDQPKPEGEALAPVADVMDRLFPVDPDSWNARLLALPKRNVERMRTGQARMPPRIVQKLKQQIAVRDRMLMEIEKAVAAAEAAGGHSIVLRYAVAGYLKSGRLDKETEPL